MAEESRGGAGTAVAEAKEKGQELVGQAQQQVAEKAEVARSEAATKLREQVDQRSTQAGEQVQAVSQALRHSSHELRTQGQDLPARMVEQAAERAERAGSYLVQADAARIMGDVEGFARRRPWLTAATGALAGFLASRFLKASSDRRYETQQRLPARDGAVQALPRGTAEPGIH